MRDSLTHLIVHDLKAPLTAITGGLAVLLEHMEKGGALSPELKKIAKNAHVSSKRLVGLIQDILDVNRMEEAKLPVKKSPTEVGALVASAWRCSSLWQPKRMLSSRRR